MFNNVFVHMGGLLGVLWLWGYLFYFVIKALLVHVELRYIPSTAFLVNSLV